MSIMMNLTSVELNVLTACQEALQEKQKLIHLLSKTFRLEPQNIFYHWINGKLPQHGYLSNKQWKYFFHGLECDLRHQDGRFIRMEFGPGGRIDTFTDWGIYKYITSFKKHWLTSIDVDSYLAKLMASPESLDNYQKTSLIVNRLKDLKLLVPVAPELAKELNGCHVKTFGASEMVVQLPKHLTDRKYFDTRVCNRLIIAAKGWQLLPATASQSSLAIEY